MFKKALAALSRLFGTVDRCAAPRASPEEQLVAYSPEGPSDVEARYDQLMAALEQAGWL